MQRDDAIPTRVANITVSSQSRLRELRVLEEGVEGRVGFVGML